MLCDGVERCRRGAQALTASGESGGNSQSEQPLATERGDGLGGDRSFPVNLCRVRSDVPFGSTGRQPDDLLLFFIQAIHAKSSSQDVKINSVVRWTLPLRVQNKGSLSSM